MKRAEVIYIVFGYVVWPLLCGVVTYWLLGGWDS